jgi:hypothetical protein
MWRIGSADVRPLCEVVLAFVLLAIPASASATGTPEQECQKGRYEAAAKYAQCDQKTMAQVFGGSLMDASGSKCRLKYAATWAKLQAKAAGTGSSCDGPRFTVGATFVIDKLTGLQWERKSDDGSVHDKDNFYAWTNGGTFSASADGPVFTSFLATLNGAPCFVGSCDWRLPTRAELETILSDAYPCAPSPCIDQEVFGPTNGLAYWSSTALATIPWVGWTVSFSDGTLGNAEWTGSEFVRAVRGGL